MNYLEWESVFSIEEEKLSHLYEIDRESQQISDYERLDREREQYYGETYEND